MAENIVLYRRRADGGITQYEFGAKSMYLYDVEPDGRRRLRRHATITDMADAIQHFPSGTPVDPKDVPAEPALI